MNLLIIVVCLVISGIAFATPLLLCSLLATWLAIGRTNIFLRMPLFLLGTLPLGLVLCLGAANQHACAAYLFGAFLIAISLPRTHLLLQLPIFVIGASYILYVPYQLQTYSLDSSVIVRFTLALSFVACLLATLRWRGFRYVDLMEGVTGVELEQGTGRDLDQWIAYLDGADASELKHAEIMALLRKFGFSFEWQKTVTLAYEKALGRWSIGRTNDGQREVVVEQGDAKLSDWLTHSTYQQFSIWQMMLVTFCVASLFGFIRNFTWSAPTVIDLKYGIPITLGVAANTCAAVWAGLSINNARAKNKVAWLVTVAVSAFVPLLMGFRFAANPMFVVPMATMFAHGALLIGLLSFARYRGYRLVPVQAKEQPQPEPTLAAR